MKNRFQNTSVKAPSKTSGSSWGAPAKLDCTLEFADACSINHDDAPQRGKGYRKRLERYIKDKWFKDDAVTIGLTEEFNDFDGEWADYWVTYHFECEPTSKGFEKATSDLVGYIDRNSTGVYTALCKKLHTRLEEDDLG
jgi:hypothetical protein